MNSLFKRYRAVVIIIGVYLLFSVAAELTTYYSYKYFDDYRVISASYDRAASDSLQNALLHTKIKVAGIKARVYDSVQGSSYHYIDCSVKVKEDYLSDDETKSKMRRIILTKIFEMFPPELYTGKIKVEYKGFLKSKVTIFSVDTGELKDNF